MPDVEQLMEVWPPDFEETLSRVGLPSPKLEMSLEEYAKTLCAIMDVPVYENIIESLHVLFTVYMEFKNNAHFQNVGSGVDGEKKRQPHNENGVGEISQVDYS
jgi:intraflagellar transport protein 46